MRHYLRKANPAEVKKEQIFSSTISHEELQAKCSGKENFILLDVREPAEFALKHIPGSKHIPLGELENRLSELNLEEEIAVICRAGARSEMACQFLVSKGAKKSNLCFQAYPNGLEKLREANPYEYNSRNLYK